MQQRINQWEPIADQVYKEMNVSPELIPYLKAQIHQESAWNPNAVSSAGARGLTQFMPGTAREFNVQTGQSSQAVRSQIRGQVLYMNYLLKMFNGDITQALQAYNWGQGNLREHLKGKKSMPKETRDYVPKIQKWVAYYR
ncbi:MULTISPECIES: lytic transglycosylase domain-containing protein [Moraxella]|nr:lytic transglycosylase domain-containing protein [Moraxella catarrhalis]STY80922.1 Membrane-bound lytic murein transglycosylase D precursor [Moraxella catarrhalis]